jgi:hypothetical protein
MKYSYQIKLDIEKDAFNWFAGCNRIFSGTDWKQRVPKEIADQVHGKTKKQAYDFLIPFLKQKYITDKDHIDYYLDFLNLEYKYKFTKACQKIREITKKPLYRNDFTAFLTTFPRGPYNYELGQLWAMIDAFDPIEHFMHELLHFQFIHYWSVEGNPVGKLNDDQFDWIKESLTVILDKDLRPIIRWPDMGYEIHEEYRQELHKFWEKNKDFDKLVKFGLKKLPDYIK